MIVWQDISSYKVGDEGLFWVDHGGSQYAAFGVVERRGNRGDLRIWDDNDFGYAGIEFVTHWCPCKPPMRDKGLRPC